MKHFLRLKFWQLVNALCLEGSKGDDDSDGFSCWMVGGNDYGPVGWEAGREDSMVLDAGLAWLSVRFLNYVLSYQITDGEDGSVYRSGLMLERLVQYAEN